MDVAAREQASREIHAKGFLGPTLKENRGLRSVGARAAEVSGVVLDETGKMRCPEGTPGAGRFTDIQKTNCNIPIAKAYPLTPDGMRFKVGIFSSHTRAGRVAQAVGSSILPGDSSKLRSPVSSASRSLLTPGSPGLGRPVGGGKFRCPAGFQNGGRFADDINGCGLRLFAPTKGHGVRTGGATRSVARAAARAGRRTNNDYTPNIPEPGDKRGRAISRVGGHRNAIQIDRAVEIPDAGPANAGRQSSSIRRAARLLGEDQTANYMIRRDGVVLSPNVRHSLLAKLADNEDMKDGVMIVAGKGPDMGATEVPLLLNSPLKAVGFAVDGDVAMLTQQREVSGEERRRLIALMHAQSGAAGIYEMAKASKGAFKFEWSGRTDLKDVRIRPANGGATRTVPRWVYDTFLKRDASAHDGGITWELVKAD